MTTYRNRSISSLTVSSFQCSILSWYKKNKRDLPWRRTDDPYKILVSEVMLQQTQVDRVVPKYEAFLKQFPTVRALANARTADVITLWSGLGYNRRAVYVQKCARAVMESGEKFPKEAGALQELPGIGPYTSRAIQTFAFHQDVPVIDTNIRRIFSRCFFAGKGTKEKIDAAVAHAVPKGKGTIWNNALMDFGSLVCTASAPRCTACPLKNLCTAFAKGNQERYLKIAPPQSKFSGSRRQYRGRVLLLLKNSKNHPMDVRTACLLLRKPKKFVERILCELEKDGLVVRKSGKILLP